jgi:sugar phosphate isomerase/epimerase
MTAAITAPERGLVVSCCARPDWTLDHSLDAYAALGYRRLECFSDWVRAALDIDADPAACREAAMERNLAFYSLHLPRLTADASNDSLARAVKAARFAAALGMRTVYLRAESREVLAAHCPALADAVAGLGLTPCLEIHANTPVHDIATLTEALALVGDGRLKGVLEVGHLWHAGETWKQAWDALGPDMLPVVHLKDIRDGKNAPLGAGVCDVAGLLQFLAGTRYQGDFVVELLLPESDRAMTEHYLGDARAFFAHHFAAPL